MPWEGKPGNLRVLQTAGERVKGVTNIKRKTRALKVFETMKEPMCRNPVKSPETKQKTSNTWAHVLLQDSYPLPGLHVSLWYKHAAIAVTPNALLHGWHPSASGSGTGDPAAPTHLTRTQMCPQGPSARMNQLCLPGILQLLGLSAKLRIILFKTFLNFTRFCSSKGTCFTIALFPI